MAKSEGITRQQIELDIKKKNFSPIYLLCGEESFYIDKIADKIFDNALSETERDFNLTIFYGSEHTMTEVLLACKRYPVMAERQVVFFREAASLKNKSELELLEHYALSPTPTTILVITYKNGTIKSSALSKAFNTDIAGKPSGILFDSRKIPEYQLGPAIDEYVRSIGCTIDDKAKAMLVEYIGNDMSHQAKEIDKLKMISPNSIRITAEMVQENIGISREYNNFELVTALANRNFPKALRILKYFSENPKNNPAVLTIGMLFNFYSNLLIASSPKYRDEHAKVEALRLKSAYAFKDYRQALTYYNMSKLFRIISIIREADARTKGIGAQQNPYDTLKELIIKISLI